MDPLRSHGLASRCIATLPTFLCVVPKETFRTLDLPLTRRLLFLLNYMGKHGVGVTGGNRTHAYRGHSAGPLPLGYSHH